MTEVSRRNFIKGAGLFVAGAAAAGMTGCKDQDSDKNPEKVSRGVVEAKATAIGFGGDIEVKMSVDTDTGQITKINISGNQETPSKGGKAIERITKAVEEAKSIEIDTISGATITTTATMVALTNAYGKAMCGDELKNLKMKPGSYTASVPSGYWRIYDLPVTLTVNEDAILNVAVPEDRFEHGDTEIILQATKDKFIPRVIANQSFNIDTVASATLSCDGIRNAARSCLKQAFEANGVNGAAAAKFMEYVDLKNPGTTQTLDTDLLVVGLGNGGIFAMLSACEEMQKLNGKKFVNIIGIDKAGKWGGKSALTHEACAVNPKEYQKFVNEGKDFLDKEDFRRRFKYLCTQDGKMVGKEECIDLMVDNSGDTVDWLSAHGWRYGTVGTGAGAPLSGGKATFNAVCTSRADPGSYEDRRQYVNLFNGQFIDFVKSQGGQVILETEGYELITSGDTVTGVKARNVVTGQEYVINAKAVIMNTGGFSSNPEMMSKYLDKSRAGMYHTVGTGQDTGLMIQAALDKGAGTFNMGMSPICMHCGPDHWISKWGFTSNPEKIQNRHGRLDVTTLNAIPNGVAQTGTAVVVGRDGKRFMDEYNYESFSKSLDVDSFAHWAGGPYFFTIVSKEVVDEIAKDGFLNTTWDSYNTQGKAPTGACPEVYEGLQIAIDEGMAFKASSIEELAKLIEIDSATLKATIDTYNGYVAAGEDKEFGKDPKYLREIKTGDFYAIKSYNTTFGTCGGLDVDAQLRVLKSDGKTPFNGLYAIGCDSLGVIHNPAHHYLGFGGVAQMWLQTGGRLAGKFAANYINDNGGLTIKSQSLSDIPAGF